MLLTGTPVQNNLHELYSLLAFVAPTIFRYKYCEEFVESYSNIEDQTGKVCLNLGIVAHNRHMLPELSPAYCRLVLLSPGFSFTHFHFNPIYGIRKFTHFELL